VDDFFFTAFLLRVLSSSGADYLLSCAVAASPDRMFSTVAADRTGLTHALGSTDNLSIVNVNLFSILPISKNLLTVLNTRQRPLLHGPFGHIICTAMRGTIH